MWLYYKIQSIWELSNYAKIDGPKVSEMVETGENFKISNKDIYLRFIN